MENRKTKSVRLVIAATAVTLLVGAGGNARAAGWDTIQSRNLSRLCPSMVGGDREYNGHGPEVTSRVGLRLANSNTIQISAYMHQIETMANWTEAVLDRSFTLAQRWDGSSYTHIWAPDSQGVWGWVVMPVGPNFDVWEDFYVDTDHYLRRVFPPKFWLAEVATMGDTGGPDIGNCTADDAYMNVRTQEFYVYYQ